MKKFSYILVAILIGFVSSCSDELLTKEPLSVVAVSQLANEKGCDALLIGAYAQIDGLSHSNNGTWPGGAANYSVEPYTSFPSQDYARIAVQFEHRLEFAMEGFRFFNLVRWGIAKATMMHTSRKRNL